MSFKDGLRKFLQAKPPQLVRLPAEQWTGFWLQLPDMPAEEQQTAAYWEIEARLEAQGLDIEDFCVKGFAYAGSGGNYWLSAVRRDVLAKWAEKLQGMAADLVAVPDEFSDEEVAKIYQNQQIGLFTQKPAARWNYRHLLLVYGIVFVLALVGIGWHDGAQYIEARRQALQMQQQWQVLQPEQERWERLQTEQKQVQAKEQQLKGIAQEQTSCYGTLLHFGLLTKPGVALAELSSDGANWQLKGMAQNHELLAQAIQKIASDNFFAGGVQLKEAEVKEDGTIAFELSLSQQKADN